MQDMFLPVLFGEGALKYLIPSLIGAYTVYYIFAARSPPVLYGSSKMLLNFFQSHVPFVNEVYSPFVFGFTGRVQTILRALLFSTEKCSYEEEFIALSDGGEMQLSWSNVEGAIDNTPTVVILPGITGCGCCSYIASLVKEINNCKYRCVVLNNRGTCRYKIKTPKTFCASHTSDVSTAMEHVRNRYPNSPLIAVGISLGGILTFNYIAQEQKDSTKPCPLTAAMCISMPWDIGMSCDKLEKSFDRVLFNYPMVHNLRQLIARNAEVLSKQFDIPNVLKSRTVREFDKSLTVEMFGYNSLEEYHADATPATKIGRVKVPVLCLNAADDPYVPMECRFSIDYWEVGSFSVTQATTCRQLCLEARR
ncbi:unnamed protein product [Hymenolepis diminuta]|uniref:Hydrolase_4 domain-containing protein n=1 Tax=Hymenolepis diminuta TaxID=6216 RepID=A0A0R3SGI1_HYMDI|nr:unnamed protein product [Hymenolepis diminuta]